MAMALRLAARGVNSTHPNPRVGCVVVADGEVAGQGWHRFAGGEHAEIIALKEAGKRAHGATMYLNLEPCSHHGKTPPCVNAVLKAGLGRVVIAAPDPNPQVDGRGIEMLRAAGVAVTLGIGKQQAQQLNRGFIKRMVHGRPWITLKMAVSLDGKTAMASGESQWITGPAARRDAHKLRAASAAILTGVGTVLRDDPHMTARLDGIVRQPLRIILDTHLSTPPRARILQPPGEVLIITAAADRPPALMRKPGVEIVVCRQHGGRIDLAQVMALLAEREINELMVESGPRLSGSMLRQGLVEQVVVYMAPDLLGDAARGMFSLGLERLADKRPLKFREVRMLGRDLRLSLDVAAADAAAE